MGIKVMKAHSCTLSVLFCSWLTRHVCCYDCASLLLQAEEGKVTRLDRFIILCLDKAKENVTTNIVFRRCL